MRQTWRIGAERMDPQTSGTVYSRSLRGFSREGPRNNSSQRSGMLCETRVKRRRCRNAGFGSARSDPNEGRRVVEPSSSEMLNAGEGERSEQVVILAVPPSV